MIEHRSISGAAAAAVPTEILARYPLDAQPSAAPLYLGGGGGLSGARHWRFPSARGEMALRAWPRPGPPYARLEQVHRWLEQAGDVGFLPVPIRDQRGQSIQQWDGGLWELSPWLQGAPDPACPPRAPCARAAFAGLAALHQRLATERIHGPSPGLQERFEAITALERGGFETLERLVEGHARSLTANFETARRFLRLARLAAPEIVKSLDRARRHDLRLQPCLRDARGEHFLFDGDRLSGLVDFGAMGIECVAADLARLIGDWLDDDRSARAIALEAYERIRPLDPLETSLIDVFRAGTAVLMGEQWICWELVDRRTFERPGMFARGIARALGQLESIAGASAGP